MSYKAIYTAERQSIRRARQFNFGRTIRIVLQKPFGQTIKDCLGRSHSARQSRLSCKHPFGQTIDDCLAGNHKASVGQLDCLADILISSVRQMNIVLAVASKLRSDNLIVLLESSPFSKTKPFVLLQLHCHLVRQLRLSFGWL